MLRISGRMLSQILSRNQGQFHLSTSLELYCLFYRFVHVDDNPHHACLPCFYQHLFQIINRTKQNWYLIIALTLHFCTFSRKIKIFLKQELKTMILIWHLTQFLASHYHSINARKLNWIEFTYKPTSSAVLYTQLANRHILISLSWQIQQSISSIHTCFILRPCQYAVSNFLFIKCRNGRTSCCDQ